MNFLQSFSSGFIDPLKNFSAETAGRVTFYLIILLMVMITLFGVIFIIVDWSFK